MTDLRDVIARAAYGAVEEYYTQPNDGMQKSEHDLVADAVLAVLADHDAKVRAQALREARAALDGWKDELVLMVGSESDEDGWVEFSIGEWLDNRADRIERKASS